MKRLRQLGLSMGMGLGMVSAILLEGLAIALTPLTAQADTLLWQRCRLTGGDRALVDNSRFDHHQFVGLSGQSITVFMESEDFDAYLILLSPQDERIGESDDISLEDINASISLTLSENGIYSVVANSHDDQGAGIYTVRVNSLSSLKAQRFLSENFHKGNSPSNSCVGR